MVYYYRYVIFSYADSGMSNTLEVEEEEEVKLLLGNLNILSTFPHLRFQMSLQITRKTQI